tara:strand:- start:250 stop:2280 length:2031 start_codon:yes stop_codon:yes gene_type:complete
VNPIKIALGDLRHETVGRISFYMPVGLGYIASYAFSKIGQDALDIRLYDNPDNMIRDVVNWKPEIVGLSNYCWNTELSSLVFKYIKELIPDVISIAGGPEFPNEHEKCRAYLAKRSMIDFYVYGEGESAFTSLVTKIREGVSVHDLKLFPQEGIMSIHPEKDVLVVGEPLPRIMNLDEIPSPYLTGFMDSWFDGRYSPAIETTRGCPFSCGFCNAGVPAYNRLAKFSVNRLEDELTYIAKRIYKYSGLPLLLHDSNFGMYENDVQVANCIRTLQDEYKWPNKIFASTGKRNYKRILNIVLRLKNELQIACSVQSLNPKTLDIIKRKNIPMNQYKIIQNELKGRGMLSVAELIVPLPEETKRSYFGGIKSIIEAGVSRITPYTTMMLKGTYLDTDKCRTKYSMKTKYRILPLQFGEYIGRKCFEVEEVCVATSTMTYGEYLECREFALINSMFSCLQFDVILKVVKELEIDIHEFIIKLWELMKTSDNSLKGVCSSFIKETEEELWDSPEEIYVHFGKKDNYNKLLKREIGDNLIRKYTTIANLEFLIPFVELAFVAIEKHVDQRNTTIIDRLNAIKRWMISLRNVAELFSNQSYINKVEVMHMSFDANGWYLNQDRSKRIVDFDMPCRYRIVYNKNEIKSILEDSKRLYGNDIKFQEGRLFNSWGINKFWRKCETF